MVENLMIIKSNSFDNESDRLSQRTNVESANTDDDESVSVGGSQQHLAGAPNAPKSAEQKSLLLSMNSASMDSVNDPDGSIPESPVIDKAKKKKRRTQDHADEGQTKQVRKKTPWYTTIDIVKPLMFVGGFLLLYLMWVNRDVLITRLLTSNARVRHTIMLNQQKLNEGGEPLSPASAKESTSKESSSSSAPSGDDVANDQDDDDHGTVNKHNSNNNDNSNNNNNQNNNMGQDQAVYSDNDEEIPRVSSKHVPQKLNIRTRRNKMSFGKDRGRKKQPTSTLRLAEDDVTSDEIRDDDIVDDDVDESTSKTNKLKEPILPSSIYSSKKGHHHHSRRHNRYRSSEFDEEDSISEIDSQTDKSSSTENDIVEQLKKLIKSEGGRRDINKVLAKETGLSESKINRFLNEKDYSIMTLEKLISVLNTFHSTILLVSK